MNMIRCTTMNILIKDTLILPMSAPDVYLSGSIAITDGIIISVGSIDSSFTPDTIIDGRDHIAIPGLINAHTHASMQYFKNFNDTAPTLEAWLEQVWRYEHLLTEEDIYIASNAAISEMIMGGTTCFADMYFFNHITAQATIENKMNANIGLTLFGDEKDSIKRIESSLSPLKNIRDNSNGSILFDVAPHAIYTCSDKTFELARDLALQEDINLHTHASESTFEVEQSYKNNNLSPIAYLDSLNALTPRTNIAHVVHPKEGDIEIFKRTKAHIIHNPSSNCKLGNGIAPISEYMNNGILVALGTDGSSSNNTLDMFKEMRLAAMISAALTHNPIAITPYEVLSMATINGAKALNREATSGSIEVGKDADIVLLNTNTPSLSPMNNPFSAVVFGASSQDVDTVIIKGNIVYKDKEFTYLDIEKTKDAIKRQWKDILKRI